MDYNIYSKVKSELLLHKIVRKQSIVDNKGRRDLVDGSNFIQCSALNMEKGKTFKPHKHIWKPGPVDVIAQESWVVIQGSVKCLFYDIDDSLIDTVVLYPGDASFTLQGGHTYEILEDDTLVYEYKTGPYTGQENDKKFI